jgi:hypothetical protein
MPIIPTCTLRGNVRAASPLPVEIAVAFAYALALTSSIASSSVRTRATHSTGPKIPSV